MTMTMKRLTETPVEWQGWKCHIDAGQYDNGRIALELVVAKEHDEGIEGERIAVATVNLVDAFCGPRQVYVKEWSENAGMTLLLIQNDIITPEPQREAASGFIVARCYDLTDEAFAKVCGDPAPVTVQYLVTLTLTPGLTERDAPAEDAILGALEVGTEGAPDGMRFEGVEEICVEDYTPAARRVVILVKGGAVQQVSADDAALDVVLVDEDNIEAGDADPRKDDPSIAALLDDASKVRL